MCKHGGWSTQDSRKLAGTYESLYCDNYTDTCYWFTSWEGYYDTVAHSVIYPTTSNCTVKRIGGVTTPAVTNTHNLKFIFLDGAPYAGDDSFLNSITDFYVRCSSRVTPPTRMSVSTSASATTGCSAMGTSTATTTPGLGPPAGLLLQWCGTSAT